MQGDAVILQAEKPRIRSDEAPPSRRHGGKLASTALQMARGDWVMVTHAQARSMQRVINARGGQSIRYRTSEVFSVLKVLEAPWNELRQGELTKGATR